MSQTKAREVEMRRFLEKFPEATTAQLYDHMMEKFPESARHQHRAMYQRVLKAPKLADIPDAQLVLGGVQVDPEGYAEDVEIESVPEPVYNDDATKSGRVKTGKALPPRRGRKRFEPVKIPKNLDASRISILLNAYHQGTTHRTSLLKVVKDQFPTSTDAPTQAAIYQLVRLQGDFEAFPAQMQRLYGERTCPICGAKAQGVDEVYNLFGFRQRNSRPQSYCRACRAAKLKVTE